MRVLTISIMALRGHGTARRVAAIIIAIALELKEGTKLEGRKALDELFSGLHGVLEGQRGG